jgi:CRISPR-associated protein Csm1
VLSEGEAKKLTEDGKLELSMFGYRVVLTNEENISRALADPVRCWDISPPENFEDAIWNGYARRPINAYFSNRQTFDGLAYNKDEGTPALTIIRGGVDDSELIFENMLKDQPSGQKPSLAKWAGLFRQMNVFFTVYLPALCAQKNTHALFAGGDDFFLIGPRRMGQELANAMAEKFKNYVAENESIHFSAGIILKNPRAPMASLATEAENALKLAKKKEEKGNVFYLFGAVCKWEIWDDLRKMEKFLDGFGKDELSRSFIYKLGGLLDMSLEERKPEAALWHNRLADNMASLKFLDDKKFCEILDRLKNGIAGLKEAFRIPLSNHIYSKR